MIGSLLFLLAAAPSDYPASPLVAEGHQHRWVELLSTEEGIGWLDEGWRGQVEVDGTRLELVLVRSYISQPEVMDIDTIFAVDCARKATGMKQAWLFKSSYGSGIDLSPPSFEMDFSSTSPDETDLKVIDFACGTGSTQE